MVGLFLSSNQLSGPIPPELGSLTNLGYLFLNDNLLSGTIPPELGNLTNLAYLYLHYNQLSGTIPATLANLSNLGYLNLDGNTPLGCWETQAALDWAHLRPFGYLGPECVVPGP